MSVTAFFKCERTINRLQQGPLGVYMDVYAKRLVAEGHCYQSGARGIRVAADYSAWLASNQHEATDVNEASIEQYERFRQKHRRPFRSDHAALLRVLNVLREVDAIGPAAATELEPLAQVAYDFEQYLRDNQGLCESTIIRHRPPLRKFLHQCCSNGVSSFQTLTGKEMTQFLVQHAHDQSPSSAKNMCWTLRAFSRYLLCQGYTAYDLSSAVPSIRTWSLTALP